ncbi:unnamed protein product [Ectocarpus sp. CCAP 1310/34]|nr:unnamed protein product [Ectocarpus sp. CCAP 1310/34]
MRHARAAASAPRVPLTVEVS